jgi:hypothetical protein
MASEPNAGLDRASEPARCRKFALSDAMILIAGTTLFLAMTDYLFAHLAEEFVNLCRRTVENRSSVWEHWPVFWVAIRRSLTGTLQFFDHILGGFLGGMVLAFLVLRGKRPRPPLRVLLRQPGTVAVLAMIFGALWIVGPLDYLFYPTVGSGQWISIHPSQTVSLAVGGCVTVAWAILALSRRWQAEPGWIDRMGRWLGVAAIVRMMLGILIYAVLLRYW